MKNVLILSTSLRGGSNSELLAKECAKGAEEAGNRVDLLSLKGKNIQYCIGCLACLKTGKCVQKDDAQEIMEKLRRADVLVFATPIYYYEMSGQMKVLIDRMNAMYSLNYKFRDVYLLTTAAEDEPEVPKRAEMGLTGWIDCYPKSHLAATLFCGGVDGPRSIEGNSKLEEAYEMGKKV